MERTLQIGSREVGRDQPTYIIAEAGINHNGSFQIAKELIKVAAEAGADAVKFQKRNLRETYCSDIVDDPAIAEMGVEYTVSNLKEVQLTDDEFLRLAEFAKQCEVQFLASPWDSPSVSFLENVGVPIYKVGSPDMTNFILLERIAETGKPLFVSTGMSEEAEIQKTVGFLRKQGADFGLLHCRSTYPAPFYNLNLRFIDELRDRYEVPVGYSGHERGIAISEAAVAMGASVVERHFTLARDMEGPDHAASLEPTGLRKMVRDIRNIERSMGVPRRYLSRGEYNNRVALGKSLVATQEIPKGTRIQRGMLTAKSPGKGISPQELYNIVGKVTRRAIQPEHRLEWADLEEPPVDEFDIQLPNWGVVVRFSDIDDHDWGDPDVFEFRVNGADLDQPFELGSYKKRLGIHAPEQKGHNLVDPSSRSEQTRKEAVKILQEVIDRTREDIAPAFTSDHPPQVIIHPGGITKDHMNLDAVPEMNDALRTSMDELDTDGVEILLENMPPLPWIYGGQRYHNNFMAADEIAQFCQETGFGLCYDTSHAKLWCNYADKDLFEHARILRPHIRYLHVADAIGVDGEGIQIGEGDIDFDRLMPLYEDFDGPIITEIWRGHEARGRGFKQAAAKLSQYV